MGGGRLLVVHNLLTPTAFLIDLSVFRQEGLFVVSYQEETSLERAA